MTATGSIIPNGVNGMPRSASNTEIAPAHSACPAIIIPVKPDGDGCRSDYGKAKYMVDEEALALGAHVIRPGLVWGVRSGGIMGILEQCVDRFPVIPYPAGGGRLKQYLIHDEDLAETVVALTAHPTSGKGILHTVAHPSPVPFRTILKTLAKRAGRRPFLVPIPWQSVMLMIKLIEATGIRFPFRSDSLVGLVHGNPSPDFTNPPAGVQYRPFQHGR